MNTNQLANEKKPGFERLGECLSPEGRHDLRARP
jgi:hypothetical protein